MKVLANSCLCESLFFFLIWNMGKMSVFCFHSYTYLTCCGNKRIWSHMDIDALVCVINSKDEENSIRISTTNENLLIISRQAHLPWTFIRNQIHFIQKVRIIAWIIVKDVGKMFFPRIAVNLGMTINYIRSKTSGKF